MPPCVGKADRHIGLNFNVRIGLTCDLKRLGHAFLEKWFLEYFTYAKHSTIFWYCNSC